MLSRGGGYGWSRVKMAPQMARASLAARFCHRGQPERLYFLRCTASPAPRKLDDLYPL